MGEILNLCIGDTHFGKKTRSYNLDIARARVEAMAGQYQETKAPYDFIRLLLLGDIVDGLGIYKTHIGVGTASLPEQVAVATESLFTLVVRLIDNYHIPIEIYGVYGNHGRLNSYADPINNVDLMCYHSLAARLEGLDLDKYPLYLCIEDQPFYKVPGVSGPLLTHKGVSHIGTAARQRLAISWLQEYQAGILVSGHWHCANISSYNNCWSIVNGSTVGSDPFSASLGYFAPPRQCWFIQDKDSGVITSFGITDLGGIA
jgi:hypothetical protein